MSNAPVCGAEYPLVDPGERILLCTGAKIYRHPGIQDKPWKCELRFQDGSDYLTIFHYLHLGFGECAHAGRKSNYWAAWCIANGGPPKKRQVMSERVFKHKWFRVVIETVNEKRKGKDREPLPADLHYSIVRKILAHGQQPSPLPEPITNTRT
jgi:hypothetical protein